MGFKKDMENPQFPVGKMLSFPAPVQGWEIRWPNPGNQSTKKHGEQWWITFCICFFVGSLFFLRPDMTYFTTSTSNFTPFDFLFGSGQQRASLYSIFRHSGGSLEELMLGQNFNQRLNINSLPDSLKVLKCLWRGMWYWSVVHHQNPVPILFGYDYNISQWFPFMQCYLRLYKVYPGCIP